MKNIIKKCLMYIMVLAISLSVIVIPTYAAGDTVISFSKNNVSVGDTVIVSVTVSVSAMYSTNINVNYDEEILSYVSGASGGGAGIVQIVEGLSGENRKTFTISFKANKAGSCHISATGTVGAQSNENGMAEDVVLSGASATLAVKDVKLSSNADLASITVSSGSLSPRFSRSTTSYTVNVKKSVSDCKVWVTTVDYGAVVAISGTSALKIGENKRVITVTAASGAQKEYTITINRSNIDDEVSEESNTSSVSSELDESSHETIIDGVPYVVLKSLTNVSIPKGYKVSKKLYNNEDIEIACDDDRTYELFYLKSVNGENAEPYTYDEINNKFERVQIITQGENSYIVSQLPEEYILPNEYYSTNVKIGDFKIKCFASTEEDFADMYYLYCYHNGKYGMYRYDTIEKVLQRSPEVSLIDANSKEANAIKSGKEDTFSNRFNRLSGNAKTIVVCAAIACIGVIVLLILLIIKFIKTRKEQDYIIDIEDDVFSDINFGDDFDILLDDESDNKE